MSNSNQEHKNYKRIEQAIHYIVENSRAQPTLEDIADNVGMSKFQLQRTFSEWAGVSPKIFLQYLTKEYAKQKLRESSVLDSALDVGLSGSSRLHDLFVTYESVTPGEYKTHGDKLNIKYGIHRSPFGDCFLATTHRGICKLSFLNSQEDKVRALKELQADWRSATINEDKSAIADTIENTFSRKKDSAYKPHLLLKGSPFQVCVWEALLKIPEGEIWSYQTVATSMGKPSAVRSIASAIAKNNIGYLIPCHRVIRSTGALSSYRWGTERKSAMIGREQY